MPTPSWRKNTSVTQKLEKSPGAFSFLQVVRLLERAAVYALRLGNAPLGQRASNRPVGKFSPPTQEAIRFRGNPSLAFPDDEVAKVETNSTTSEQWQVMVNMIGLTGSTGILPFHYTELLQQRLKQKDATMLHFFDLFNHRTTSLFYQASTKYRLPLAVERHRLTETDSRAPDNHTRALLSIIGLGSQSLMQRNAVKDESLIFYSGLFSQQIKTATGLKQLLESYFDVPVKIREFIGEWHSLIDDVRTRLPDRNNRQGQNVCLGRTTLLGRTGWFSQGKTRVVLGPLNEQQYVKFAPGSSNLKALNELVRLYLGVEREYDFLIQVNRRAIPNKISLSKDTAPIMGWSTWLSSKPPTAEERQQVMDIHLTAEK